MALTQKSLEEPLLSRSQSAVCRNIACAAQLAEASKLLSFIETITVSTTNGLANSDSTAKVRDIKEYLRLEATRVLMQIKLPAAPNLATQKATTETPSKSPTM